MKKNARSAQKAATRAAVKEAARRCFAQNGFAETSVGDISRSAGVAHGTFYVHFPSKESALDELLEDFNQRLVEQLTPIFLRAANEPLEAVVRWSASAFLDHWQAERAFVECYAKRSALGLDLQSLRDGVNPPVTNLLRVALAARAVERGVQINTDLASTALLSLWLRIGMQYLFNDAVSRDEAIDTLTKMSLGALGALLEEEDQK